jgi:hypothetical protein
LATASGNQGRIRLWDWHDPGLPRRSRLTEKAREELWTACASADAGIGYRAVVTLLAAPRQAVPLLDKRLKRVEPVAAKQLERLVAGLDDSDFEVRQSAFARLAALGDAAEAALRAALARRPSLELHKRITELLAALEHPSPEQLRGWRGVEVLECLGTAEARRVLHRLAGGAAGAGLTRDAKAALQRLDRAPAPTRPGTRRY